MSCLQVSVAGEPHALVIIAFLPVLAFVVSIFHELANNLESVGAVSLLQVAEDATASQVD